MSSDAQWLRDLMPESLHGLGPGGLSWWQLIALGSGCVLAAVGGLVLGWATRRILGHLMARTRVHWDDELVRRLARPMSLALGVGVGALLLPLVGLSAAAQSIATAVLRASAIIAVFWGLWRAVEVGAGVLVTAERLKSSGRTLVFVGARVIKAALVIAGLLLALHEMGVAVTGILAGLGIGGLAIALAAQKSVENLFGGMALAIDAPFGVGDFVKVEDFVGTVEAIGLRSTRLRTLDRTLITIPNGRLAEMRLESFSVRDRLRLACTLSLTYGTTAPQLRRVLAEVERVLRAHPRIWGDAVVVRFKALEASSLDIEVMAWFQTCDWSEFQLIRQELLLAFMEVVAEAGASFAFPTQTLHLVAEPPTASRPGPPAGP